MRERSAVLTIDEEMNVLYGANSVSAQTMAVRIFSSAAYLRVQTCALMSTRACPPEISRSNVVPSGLGDKSRRAASMSFLGFCTISSSVAFAMPS